MSDLRSDVFGLLNNGINKHFDTEARVAEAEASALLASMQQQDETHQRATPDTVAGQTNAPNIPYKDIAVYGGLGLLGLAGVALLAKGFK